MATKRMNESWRRMKTRIETIWDGAEFDDDELKRARGDLQQLVRIIEDKTGEPRTAILQKMNAIL